MSLTSLSFELNAGAHALLGAPDDGGPLLLAVLAGRVPVRAGSIRIADGHLGAPETRRTTAYVPSDPALPEALRVDEALALAADIRGEERRAPDERLAAFGLEPLGRRRVDGLTRDEVRAVALAEALTSKVVRLVLLEEPFVGIDPRAAALLTNRVRARAREGACVVVATASTRDATDLADDCLVLRHGHLLAKASAQEVRTPEATTRVRVLASDPRALLAALASSPAVRGLETHARAIVVHGAEPTALTAEIGRAAVRAAVEIFEMRPEPEPAAEASVIPAAGRAVGAL